MFQTSAIFLVMFLWITLITVKGDCIWYSVCSKISEDAPLRTFNCNYTGPAKKLEDSEGLELLRYWCPYYINNGKSYTETCCDTKQLHSFDNGSRIAATMLQRCPSCIRNFMNVLCEITCSPKQSEHVKVIEIIPMDGKTVVNKIDVYVTPKALNGTFDSCKNIVMPSTGVLALDMMCGDIQAVGCSPQVWFNYMGNPQANIYAPFLINYIYQEKPSKDIIPIDFKITGCNVSLDKFTPACSCVDCEASCPPTPPEKESVKSFKIFGLPGLPLIMFFVFLIGSSIFLSAVCWGATKYCPCKKNNEA